MRRFGFTLIELLLVLVIIGVITAVAVPQYVRSLEGNRLRTAGRMVIAAGRYARSMAVLHQRDVAVRMHVGENRLTVEEWRPSPPRNDDPDSPVLSWGSDEPATPPSAPDGHPVPPFGNDRSSADAPARPPGRGMDIRLERELDQVTIESVRVQGASASALDTDIPLVVYRSNGRCHPYVVRLADRQGSALEIRVDALASAETTRENRP